MEQAKSHIAFLSLHVMRQQLTIHDVQGFILFNMELWLLLTEHAKHWTEKVQINYYGHAISFTKIKNEHTTIFASFFLHL